MGLRGFEALAFVSFVAVLLVISLVTTIASLFIIYKLRLIPSKEAITFAHDSVVFHGDTDLDRVYLSQNQINGNISVVDVMIIGVFCHDMKNSHFTA